MTLIELVIVVAAAALVLVATMAYAIPWMAKESMRSAVYDVQTYLQLARIEAISRNRDCRFVVDTSTGGLSVFDSNGTADPLDDTELYSNRLPENVVFTRPEGGSAVTLSQIDGGPSYEAVFTSDGTVTAGTGEVVLHGGEMFGRVQIFGAGGIQVDRWDGSQWAVGT
jgi:Tfp pilus assembly protein FimT